MRSIKSIAFASWMLEHLTFGSDNEALSGDLLEEFQFGRSATWYWRQALTAIVSRACWSAREFAVALAFSAAWSMLYPAWRFIVAGSFLRTATDRWAGLVWPYSALADLSYGVVPVVSFVWLGLMVYLLLRAGAIYELSGYRLILGLSQSLAVLLVETIVLLHHLKHPQVDLTHVIRGDFYSVFHLLNISIPIALSLLVALLSLGVRAPRIGQRKRTFRGAGIGVVRRLLQALCLIFSLSLFSAAQTNSTAPTVQFVTVDQDVKLEVLDWGGTGRPLIFLAGLGNDAHVFDKFATKFTANNHVYGITRRGFGASSKPAPANGNYAADRLGDDVIVVLDTLKLDHPVLAGHSLAGEELSSIGSRHPERVAGLIYLDAGYGYAFYDRAHGDGIFDFFQLQKRLDDFMSGTVRDDHKFMADFSTNISRLDKELQEFQKRNASMPVLHAPPTPIPPIIKAINLGGQEYTDIRVPILAIFACPHNLDFDPSLRNDPKAKATALADNLFYTSRQADAFAAGLPSAHVVRLLNADHYVFRSNETDVIREMNAFLTKLP
jgi:pimeloyl-ACP methyl ester carboxylesterase